MYIYDEEKTEVFNAAFDKLCKIHGFTEKAGENEDGEATIILEGNGYKFEADSYAELYEKIRNDCWVDEPPYKFYDDFNYQCQQISKGFAAFENSPDFFDFTDDELAEAANESVEVDFDALNELCARAGLTARLLKASLLETEPRENVFDDAAEILGVNLDDAY